MSELLAEPTVRLFAICAGILALKMLLIGTCCGLLRVARGVYITPEDYTFMGKAPKPQDETIERVRRAHMNAIEHLVPFFGIGLLYALSGGSYRVAWWLFVTFTAARVIHTVTYVASLQPWRTIFFEVANISLAVMAILLLVNLL
jgi:glutathione S-transferase